VPIQALLSNSGKTKAGVVVVVVRPVVVAVSRTDVPAVVDPTAATQDTVIALLKPSPGLLYHIITDEGKRRKFSLRHSRLSAFAVMARTDA
jgi:hypothetical protein